MDRPVVSIAEPAMKDTKVVDQVSPNFQDCEQTFQADRRTTDEDGNVPMVKRLSKS
jgi:hypothetical protein